MFNAELGRGSSLAPCLGIFALNQAMEKFMSEYVGGKETIRWALDALRYEIIDFWVEYPFEVVQQAGPKSSLHYYV
jgi:hypothetical protein